MILQKNLKQTQDNLKDAQTKLDNLIQKGEQSEISSKQTITEIRKTNLLLISEKKNKIKELERTQQQLTDAMESQMKLNEEIHLKADEITTLEGNNGDDIKTTGYISELYQ